MTLKDEQKSPLFVRGQQMMVYALATSEGAKEDGADCQLLFLAFYASRADYEMVRKAFARHGRSSETWSDYQEKFLGILSVLTIDSPVPVRFLEIARCDFHKCVNIPVKAALPILGSEEPNHVLTVNEVLSRVAVWN